ncbi:MAG: class I SAM-dependent methyltransferase [Verrucomicrobia bacterium]|nr:class I SAM-dependent methyltransferase [Verrucomicrobiota bacterium]
MIDNDFAERPGYVLGHSDAELKRLMRQGAFYADLTEDVLRRAGLCPGTRVLDIGCGAGDVSLLAARLVGPSGLVVGVDRSEQAIALARARVDRAGFSWVRFVVAELETFVCNETFDALIGRFVLLYLSDPATRLRALARHLRSGGIVAFQEMDMHFAHSVPEAPLFRQCLHWIINVFEKARFEPDMGSRLFATYLCAGLPAPRMIATGRLEGGPDSPAYEYLAETVRSLIPMIERFDVATAAEIGIETLAARLREEAVAGNRCIFPPLLIGAWSRWHLPETEANGGAAPA